MRKKKISMHSQSANFSMEKTGRARSCLAREKWWPRIYNERRKLGCLPLAGGQQLVEVQLCLGGFRAVCSHEASMAERRLLVRPSCKKKIRCRDPQRSRTELIAAGTTLGNVVRQAYAHVVDFYVGDKLAVAWLN